MVGVCKKLEEEEDRRTVRRLCSRWKGPLRDAGNRGRRTRFPYGSCMNG